MQGPWTTCFTLNRVIKWSKGEIPNWPTKLLGSCMCYQLATRKKAPRLTLVLWAHTPLTSTSSCLQVGPLCPFILILSTGLPFWGLAHKWEIYFFACPVIVEINNWTKSPSSYLTVQAGGGGSDRTNRHLNEARTSQLLARLPLLSWALVIGGLTTRGCCFSSQLPSFLQYQGTFYGKIGTAVELISN